MKFLWLDINSSYSHSSLALPALHSQLSNNLTKENEWYTINGTLKTNEQEIINKIISIKPNFIFATCWLFNINYITTILKKVHSLEPQISVFLGGPEFLGNNHEFLLNNKYVNGVFKGEGEEVFNNFISSLIEGNSNWKCLQGFEYIESNNYISKDVVTTKDFCALKSPETSIFFNWDKPFVQLETSRGCFNKCKFCVSGIDCSPVQNLPLELLRERVLLIKQKGIKEIRVLDRTFNGNTQRAIDLLNLFKEFYPGMSFHLEIHPALLSTKFRRFLEQELPTGMLHVEAGMQSLNENVILECSRNGAPNKSLEGLEYLINLKKFEVHADLIAGLPLYTYKDLLSDVITLMEVKPGEIQLELLKLLPGTYFRDNADLYNIKYSPLPPYEVLETNNISYYELNKAVVLSKILDRWYNNSIWRDILVLYINNSLEKLADLVESLSKTDFAYKSYSQEYLSLLLFNFIKNEESTSFEFKKIWIENGMSLKKEPATSLLSWKPGNSLYNPLFIEGNSKNKYYYLQFNNIIKWYLFNSEIERTKPIKEIEITCY